MSSALKKKIIGSMAPALNLLQLPALFRRVGGGIGHILMFHRVLPSDKRFRIHNHQSLEVTPRQLEDTIQFFRKRNYDFLSLDQLYLQLTSNVPPDRKFVVFTFDDGYRDNLTLAYPILKKYHIPFTIYIFTHLPDRKAILWWYLLEDLLRDRNSVDFRWEGRNYSFKTHTPALKESAFDRIRSFINRNFSTDHPVRLYRAIFQQYLPEWKIQDPRVGLTWEEIRTISRDPLVTIGAHTIHHYALSQLSPEEMEKELAGSKARLESETGQPVEHLAYPYGKATEAGRREFETARRLGFKTATTTRMGNIFPQHKENLLSLPRLSINGITCPAVLELQTSGLLPWMVHRGKRVITD